MKKYNIKYKALDSTGRVVGERTPKDFKLETELKKLGYGEPYFRKESEYILVFPVLRYDAALEAHISYKQDINTIIKIDSKGSYAKFTNAELRLIDNLGIDIEPEHFRRFKQKPEDWFYVDEQKTFFNIEVQLKLLPGQQADSYIHTSFVRLVEHYGLAWSVLMDDILIKKVDAEAAKDIMDRLKRSPDTFFNLKKVKLMGVKSWVI